MPKTTTSIVLSSTSVGYDGQTVIIECDLSNGLPGITIVGLGAKAIDESRERIRSAIKNSDLEMPKKKIILNLAPADLPKDGTSYDLPMALAILLSSGNIPNINNIFSESSFIGELSLNGSIRGVSAIISHVEVAKHSGLKNIFIPRSNLQQAQLISDINIFGVSNLKEVVQIISSPDPTKLIPKLKPSEKEVKLSQQGSGDFADIHGQDQAKRALEIAAAGHHNVLMNGSPGAGKTMMAKAITSILPPPSEEEIISITKIHSLAGTTDQAVVSRPFRSPHHTSSSTSIIGGGKVPRPGEISLSHKGVLFLDEVPEFPRVTLEALRQPLEDRIINISRANQSSTYPADFMLVATQNPCPCGYKLDPDRACTCSPLQISSYSKKISGPLLDRIDIVITVQKVKHELLLGSAKAKDTSADIKSRVLRARAMQEARFKSKSFTNANMTNLQIKSLAKLSSEAKEFLDTAAKKLDLSARGYMKTIKVARTIADLDQSEDIKLSHLTEALQYRSNR
jgi:magnesium chelatase family protein